MSKLCDDRATNRGFVGYGPSLPSRLYCERCNELHEIFLLACNIAAQNPASEDFDGHLKLAESIYSRMKTAHENLNLVK